MCQCWWMKPVAPCDRLYVFVFWQRGMYLPQTYIIQEEMVVMGRVRNMRQLGPFIHRLCYGKETYRLRRRSGQRREFQDFLIYYWCMPSQSSVWIILLLQKIEINKIFNVFEGRLLCSPRLETVFFVFSFFFGFFELVIQRIAFIWNLL